MTDEQWREIRALLEESDKLQRRSEELQERCTRQSMNFLALEARCRLLLKQQALHMQQTVQEYPPEESS